MHFFYLDESGDTGRDLANPDQPVMVLGGVDLRDEGWNRTRTDFHRIITNYFGGAVPSDFEVHGYDLLSPQGSGAFAGHSMQDRTGLANRLIDLILARKHGIHLIAIDKRKVQTTPCGLNLAFNPSRPYLLAFDYMVTYVNWYVREKLGATARGMIILDEKREYHASIEKITRTRRFEGPVAHRTKWITEITYPVDSRKNPMIQLSDLVVLCARRFLETDNGYRNDWTDAAKHFYAACFANIYSRIARKATVERGGRNMGRLNAYISAVRCDPVGRWKKRYGL